MTRRPLPSSLMLPPLFKCGKLNTISNDPIHRKRLQGSINEPVNPGLNDT